MAMMFAALTGAADEAAAARGGMLDRRASIAGVPAGRLEAFFPGESFLGVKCFFADRGRGP